MAGTSWYWGMVESTGSKGAYAEDCHGGSFSIWAKKSAGGENTNSITTTTGVSLDPAKMDSTPSWSVWPILH